MTVLDWEARGSWDAPWRPNYMYVLAFEAPLTVRAGFDPLTEQYRALVTLNSSVLVDEHHDEAKDALAACQRFMDGRMSSHWLWTLTNDRDGNVRPRRVMTRGHEQALGGRYSP